MSSLSFKKIYKLKLFKIKHLILNIYSYGKENKTVALFASFGAGLIAIVVYTIWTFVGDAIKYKAGDLYIKELIATELLLGKDRATRTVENFQSAKYPLYRLFWGLKSLEDARRNDDAQLQKETIESIMGSATGYSILEDCLRVELANLKLQTGDTIESALSLLKKIDIRDPFWAVATEFKMNTLLQVGDFESYEELYKEVLSLAPSHLADRISETLYIVKYQDIFKSQRELSMTKSKF